LQTKKLLQLLSSFSNPEFEENASKENLTVIVNLNFYLEVKIHKQMENLGWDCNEELEVAQK